MPDIRMTDDFDLDLIARSGQCFRWRETGNGGYLIPHGERLLRAEPLGEGVFRLSCGMEEWERVWRPYFDMEENYAAIRARVDPEADPFLHEAAAYGAGIRILRQEPWETLVSFIISQNKNIPAIRHSIELLCRAAGALLEDPGEGPWHAFPGPEAILRLSEEQLRACKLGYRWQYVREAARAAAEGRIDFAALARASQEDALAALTGLYGVGVKVASCCALFGLHLLDAFPVDVWMKRILQNEYPAGYPRGAYSPYNGVYQQYMFFYYRDFSTKL